jgi:hypothetical protein
LGRFDAPSSNSSAPGFLFFQREKSSFKSATYLGQGAREEIGTGISSASLAHQEYDILTTLKGSGDTPEIVFAVDWLLIDLQNYVATREPNILGERARFHIGDYDTLVRRYAEPIRHLWSN